MRDDVDRVLKRCSDFRVIVEWHQVKLGCLTVGGLVPGLVLPDYRVACVEREDAKENFENPILNMVGLTDLF